MWGELHALLITEHSRSLNPSIQKWLQLQIHLLMTVWRACQERFQVFLHPASLHVETYML
jgi:hypothetical protein